MEAIVIEVLATKNRSGKSRTSGNDYNLELCQCVVREELLDGTVNVDVGELMLPKGHPVPVPGLYTATFKVTVGFDKKIQGNLEKLTPYVAPKVASSTSHSRASQV